MMVKNFDSWDKTSLSIWILYADRIPPHLGISDSSGYFSLKVSGKDEGLEHAHMLELVRRKRIPTLVYALKLRDYLPLELVFSSHQHADGEFATCLFPLREVCGVVGAETIHDLLKYFDVNQLVDAVYGIHLPENFKGISEYSFEDVIKHISILES